MGGGSGSGLHHICPRTEVAVSTTDVSWEEKQASGFIFHQLFSSLKIHVRFLFTSVFLNKLALCILVCFLPHETFEAVFSRFPWCFCPCRSVGHGETLWGTRSNKTGPDHAPQWGENQVNVSNPPPQCLFYDNDGSVTAGWLELRTPMSPQCQIGIHEISVVWTGRQTDVPAHACDQVSPPSCQVTMVCGTSMLPSPGSAGTLRRSEETPTTSPSSANQLELPASASRSEVNLSEELKLNQRKLTAVWHLVSPLFKRY